MAGFSDKVRRASAGSAYVEQNQGGDDHDVTTILG